MKVIILLFIFTFNLFPSGSKSVSKLSPLTKLFINDLNEFDSTKLRSRYLIYNIEDIEYVGALLILDPSPDFNEMESLGCILGAKVNQIQSIKIPLSNFKKFISNSDYKYFQLDEKIGFHLDQALKYSNDNDAFYNLVTANSFTYRESIVGIIDVGFHFKHPMMYENNRNKIDKIWVQHITNNSMKRPNRYSYGVEFKPNDPNAFQFDTRLELHGAHVAGIAAGSRFNASSQYVGVSPNSKLVIVSPIFNFDSFVSTGHSNILDAVKYIFDFAESQGKPAVINMSIGHNIGPHDGSSIFDMACNQLSGPGRIIVTSAGNNGQLNSTIYKDFTSNPSPIRTIANAYVTSDGAYNYLDIWDNSGKDFCIKLGLYKNNNFKFTEAICTDFNSFQNQLVSIADFRVLFKIVSTESDFNGGSRLFINSDVLGGSGQVILEITSGTGEVFAWHCGVGGATSGEFDGNSGLGLTSGRDDYQISEIGGNADSVITVAAYNVKSNMDNIFGYDIVNSNQSRRIADFSSKGPAANHKMKPDISAPGVAIVSAYNPEFVDNFTNKQTSPVVQTTVFNGTTFHVGSLSGTSMSSPFVAGVVALMLSVNPFLGPSDIKQMINSTAINDLYTGQVRELGDKTWGHGKINIYDAVQIAQSKFGEFNMSPRFSFYPNPIEDYLYLEFEENSLENAKVSILDLSGRAYIDELNVNPSLGIQLVPVSFLSPGYYILNLKYSNEIHTFNLIKGVN